MPLSEIILPVIAVGLAYIFLVQPFLKWRRREARRREEDERYEAASRADAGSMGSIVARKRNEDGVASDSDGD